MATYRKRNNKWQVRIQRRNNPPISKTFVNKEDDKIWARQQEREIDLGIKGVRLGLSYTRAKFDLDSSDVSGTITDGTTTINAGVKIKSSEFKSVGLDFDNTAKLYMANLYYDFDLNEKVKPFVGVGAGWADIENIDGNEFTASVSAGAKYYFDKQVYLGGKASYTNINSPKDDLGLKYDDIELYSATVMLGYEF